MASLQGKVIAITGAASGMGAATARIAAERGAFLSLADVNPESLKTIVDELKTAGTNVIGFPLDISDDSGVEDWISQTVKHFGRLDGAANVAGVGAMPGGKIIYSITETTNEHWDYMMRVNLTGTFYCLRSQLRAMSDNGAIINVTSLSGIAGYDGHGGYVSSKHGVQGLTKVAAKEAASRGIRVNALAPGRIDTPLLRSLFVDDNGLKAHGSSSGVEKIPLQRFGEAEDVARTICFALSDDSKYITGDTFVVDGGRIL